MGGHWVDIDQAASKFDVTAKTIRRWIKDPTLGIKAEMRQGRWYIDLDSIRHRTEVLPSPTDPDLLAQLRADLAAARAETAEERKAKEAAQVRAAGLEGLLRAKEQALIEDQTFRDKVNRAGLIDRILRRW